MVLIDLAAMVIYSGILYGVSVLLIPHLRSWIRGVLFVSDTLICMWLTVSLYGTEPRLNGISIPALLSGLVPFLFCITSAVLSGREKLESGIPGPVVTKRVFALNGVLILMLAALVSTACISALILTFGHSWFD